MVKVLVIILLLICILSLVNVLWCVFLSRSVHAG